jgi:hypothetical protein
MKLMSVYKYEFDSTSLGDARYNREAYEILHGALLLLEAKLKSWNTVALSNGALEAPYTQEVDDIHVMTEWGEVQLAKKEAREICVHGISVASIRYQKAALIHAAWHYESEATDATKATWPPSVAEAVRGKARRFHQEAEKIEQSPAAILDELRPQIETTTMKQSDSDTNWDAFVSHASEDKDAFVRPLVDALRERSLNVWYDEFTLTVGDSLRRSIDRGLARSRFGIVVLSPMFFSKEWPQKELDGLVARESNGKKVILPVWHEVDAESMAKYSPMLADRVAVSSESGLTSVVDALLAAIRK